MTVKMILAVDQGNSIGWSNGKLPWHIPRDLERFKNLTLGHDVVMGRATFDSLKLPDGLPNRRNVVLTRMKRAEVQEHIGRSDRVTITHSFDWVRAHQACLGCKPQDLPDLWIIGGAMVYQEALRLKLVDEIYLTKVHAFSGADVRLPFEMFDPGSFVINRRWHDEEWEIVSRQLIEHTHPTPSIEFIKIKKL